MNAQLGLFDRTVYKWPCRRPGARSQPAYPGDEKLRAHYRARFAPVLATTWQTRRTTYPSGETIERVELHWRHSGPLTRADYEYDSIVAVSINPEGFYWTVRWLVAVGRAGFSPWSRGQSESLEAAKVEALAKLAEKAPRLMKGAE
jgi:hypothetical protein